MFERYIICEEGFRNFRNEFGAVEGFEVKIRIPYYRGVSLSMVDYLKLAVNGKEYQSDVIRFTVASGSYMMGEMETVYGKRWQFGEKATLRVYQPGGLVHFDQDVELWIRIRPPYIGDQPPTYSRKRLALEDDLYLGIERRAQ
jgi:hypothetical protein